MARIKPGEVHENEDLITLITYPRGLELDRQRSRFTVLKPFFIAEEDGQLVIMSWWWKDVVEGKDVDGLIKEDARWKGSHSYNPFQVHYLFEELGRVNPTNGKSILDFCNRYGLLGENDGDIPSKLAGLKYENHGVYRESLQYFAMSVREMQDTLRLYHDIQSESPLLEERKEAMKEAVLELYPEWGDQLKNADALTYARVRLMIRINKHLGEVFPMLQLGIDGRFYPGHTGLTLLGVAYFQLYEVITSEVHLRECPYCHSLFVPRTHRAKFCPPLEGYQRSVCENRYNQMTFRTRKNIREGKETVQEAAARLGRPVSEVRSWIEDKKGDKGNAKKG